MKRTFLSLSVAVAVICCTLAFAATKAGSFLLLNNRSTTEATSEKGTPFDKSLKCTLTEDAKKLKMPETLASESSGIKKAPRRAEGDAEVIPVDLWAAAPKIVPATNNCYYDSETQSFSWANSSDLNYAFVVGANESNNFVWPLTAGYQKYVFKGTITATNCESVVVQPWIAYVNEDNNINPTLTLRNCEVAVS